MGQQNNTRTSAWTWPKQGKIDEQGWEIWKTSLEKQ